MISPIEQILAALREYGINPRESAKGWTCRCPSHGDRSPSLSIGVGSDGKVLLHCHARCTPEAIVGSLGLTLADLFPADSSSPRGLLPRPRRRGRGDESRNNSVSEGGFVAVAEGTKVKKPVRKFLTANEAVAELERQHGPRSAFWTYHNDCGEPVGVVVRWNVPADPADPKSTPGKKILPVSRMSDGSGWVNCGMSTPRPLYGLPDLMVTKAGSRVYVVEGEKTADAARSIGLMATTSPHGSKSAKQADWSPVTGHEVVISPDHDEAGEKYANDVTTLCMAVGAKSVRVIRLADLWAGMPEGGDMADFLEHRGHDAEAVRAEIETLVNKTEPAGATPEVPAAIRFDLDAAFPARAHYVRDYLSALSRSTQTPIEMPALLGLAIASATVCNVARVRGHGDHVEPAQLWGLVLCEPAVRKSAVLSELLAPVVAWEKHKADELGPQIAAAVQRRKIDEKRLKTMEDNAARTIDPKRAATVIEEAVRLAQEIQADPIPTPPALLASEPTPEALARQMVANHGRALLASAEADALDIVQGRYSGARNYGILLKGHAGDAVRAQRVGRTGDTIDHPALAVALCVQPQAVRELWADPHAEGRGLLARFAVILPRDRIGYRDVRPPPVPAPSREHWRAAIDRLLSFEPSDSPVIIELSVEADTLYHDFQRNTEMALGIGELAERRAWGGKLCGLMLRIALTLHALETWAISGKPNDFPTISVETIRAAIAWAEYLAVAEKHARELLGESNDQREHRRLVEWIRRGSKDREPGTATVRDLTRGPREYRHDPERAARDLADLVATGDAVWVLDHHGPKGGRPPEKVRLVSRYDDTGDGDETQVNTENRAGSVAATSGGKHLNAEDGWGEV